MLMGFAEIMEKVSNPVLSALALTVAASIAGCGGGKTSSAPPKDFKPTITATSATFTGTISNGLSAANTPVTAYDAKGLKCASGTSDAAGRYTMTGKCIFPVMLAANTPDLLGAALFNAIPTISAENERVSANITTLTTASLYITNGTFPVLGTGLNSSAITKERQDSSQAKLLQILKPVFDKLSIEAPASLLSGEIQSGSGIDSLMGQLSINYEQISSLGQKILRIYLPSENRPITIVLDSKNPDSMRVDLGLGISPESIDLNRINKSRDSSLTLSSLINEKGYEEIEGIIDNCFRHNGMPKAYGKNAIFDSQAPWGDTKPKAKSFKLVRYNTNVNFDNSTEENINSAQGDLAYFSFDYIKSRGASTRTYLWAVRGNFVFKDGCSSSGPDWRILGNQRDVYIRPASYAVHKIKYNSGFGGRVDEYGKGLRFVIGASSSAYTHALISGPGLPSDGVTFMSIDGAFLLSSNNPTAVRKAALLAMNTPIKSNEPDGEDTFCDAQCLKANPKSHMPKIFDAVEDTQSVILTDQTVASIPDSFYGNTYTFRLYSNYDDLNPAKTFEAQLPKKPHFSSEIKPINYPSLDVNIDSLVSSIENPNFVTANWSLPDDYRGSTLQGFQIGFERRSCTNILKWPSCSKRSDQFNEYMFSSKYLEGNQTSAQIKPSSGPTGTKTFYSAIGV